MDILKTESPLDNIREVQEMPKSFNGIKTTMMNMRGLLKKRSYQSLLPKTVRFDRSPVITSGSSEKISGDDEEKMFNLPSPKVEDLTERLEGLTFPPSQSDDILGPRSEQEFEAAADKAEVLSTNGIAVSEQPHSKFDAESDPEKTPKQKFKPRLMASSSRSKDQPFSLRDKTILVTGALGNLGLQICIACAKAGANIAAVDYAPEPSDAFEEVVEHASLVHYYSGDIVYRSKMEELVKHVTRTFGAIHGLVHCAVMTRLGSFHEVASDTLWHMINNNLTGPFQLTQIVIESMLRRKTKGSIIFLTSVFADRASRAAPASLFGMTKAGIAGLSRQLAAEYAKDGIRINTIVPGQFITGKSREKLELRPALAEQINANIMLGRMGQPTELNGAVVFLLSEASSFVTGTDLKVDGGESGW